MCGIVGILNLTQQAPPTEPTLRQMLGMIRHRGPDQFGIYLDEQVGLGNARLSIIDLAGGRQPIPNEDNTLWIVFNGEIFNYVDLRPELEKRGHVFRTNTDTEVILHLYEEYGADCLQHLNGQFTFAIWNTREQSLFIARDRVGIRPLFYTVNDGRLIFGSEIKTILAVPGVERAIDPIGFEQVFTFWSTITPNTVFEGIKELPPAHYMLVKDGEITQQRYWSLNFTGGDPAGKPNAEQTEKYLDELRDLLIDATQIRLRADVPVGAYLSGGLDSSLTTAIIRNHTQNKLKTFSITFADADFDESEYQREVSAALNTDHAIVHVTQQDIADVFPDVVWHTEIPVIRTAPAPMYLLSKLVRDHDFKVVMTGEGADEFFGGYNIFKETKVRRFWSHYPDSTVRPLLLRRIYPYIANLSDGAYKFTEGFFKQGLEDIHRCDYSHALRWRNTSRAHRFFSDEMKATKQTNVDVDFFGAAPHIPDKFHTWNSLEQAQYLEISVFMSQYLLSSQGDRMGMANSVEGRYPFLDHRVMEFASTLPAQLKLFGLTEKYMLKRLGKDTLPEIIWKRPKRPYRAPIHKSFFFEGAPDYARDMLSEAQVNRSGLFNPNAVQKLVKVIDRGRAIGETDDMAVAGILSAQLLHNQFIDQFNMPTPINDDDDVEVFYGAG